VVIASYSTVQNANERLFLQNANEHLFLQANMLWLYLTCIGNTLEFFLASALRLLLLLLLFPVHHEPTSLLKKIHMSNIPNDT